MIRFVGVQSNTLYIAPNNNLELKYDNKLFVDWYE